ncbi:MAG TPA: hypothetical protein DD473_11130 [Planctomycetaceae bacterium]|nr:hypothetical protein [Planctomycetaceae bacterium]
MNSSMHKTLRHFGLLAFSILVLIASPLRVTSADEQPIAPVAVDLGREVDFDQDVAPILKNNCLACHNSKIKEGSLNLESHVAMMQGGDSGPSIVPGKSDESYLFQVVSRQEESFMPPLPNKMNAKKLTGEEVWKLKRWIDLGAPAGKGLTNSTVVWSTMPQNLQPVYALSLFPNESRLAVGRGNRVQVISITNPLDVSNLIDPELPAAHRDYVNAIAVHPNGRLLATAGYRNVKIWQKDAFQILENAHINEPVAAFSHSPAGTKFAVIGQTGRLFLGSNEGHQISETKIPAAKAVAVNDAGNLLAIATEADVKVLDPTNPESIVTLTVPSPVTQLAFHLQTLVTTHADGQLRTWSKAEADPTWQESGAAFKKSDAAVIEFRPVAENKFSALSADGNAVIWDLTNRTAVRGWTVSGDTTKLCFTEDLKTAATVDKNGVVRVWDANGKQTQEFLRPASTEKAVKDQERALAIAKAQSAYSLNLVKLAETDLKQREEAVQKAEKAIEPAKEEITKVTAPRDEAVTALEAANKKLAEKPEDAELKKQQEAAQKKRDEAVAKFDEKTELLKRAETTLQLEKSALERSKTQNEAKTKQSELAAELVKKIEGELKVSQEARDKSTLLAVDIAFEDAQLLRILTSTGTIETWNVSTKQPVDEFQVPEWQSSLGWIPISGDRYCEIRADGRIEKVSLSPQWTLQRRLGPANGELAIEKSEFVDRVTALDFSPEGSLLATGGGDPSRDGELKIWNWKEGTLVRTIPNAHSDSILTIKFSEDGQKLATGSADKFVKVFAVDTGEPLGSFEGHTEHVLSVDWMADGLTIASASADKSVKIWDVQDGSQKRTITGFGKQVTGLEYIGVSDNLATCCGDKIVRLYQAGNGRNYRNLSGAQNYLNAFDVTEDESLVIAGGHTGVVRIWDGKSGKLLQTLEPN